MKNILLIILLLTVCIFAQEKQFPTQPVTDAAEVIAKALGDTVVYTPTVHILNFRGDIVFGGQVAITYDQRLNKDTAFQDMLRQMSVLEFIQLFGIPRFNVAEIKQENPDAVNRSPK